MPASLHLPRFQPANDRPTNDRPKTAAHVVTLAPQRGPLFPLLAGGVLLFGLTAAGTIAIEWNRQDSAASAPTDVVADTLPAASLAAPIAPATSVTVTEPETPPVAKTEALTDIVLPASALAAPEDAPPAEEVDAVAAKIAETPALKKTRPHIEFTTGLESTGKDANALLTEARTALINNDAVGAYGLYRHVLALDARNHDALYGSIVALARQSEDDEAIMVAERLLKLYPHDTAAEANLAQILMRTGRKDEALQHMYRAARAAPGNLALRLDLASLYDRAGRTHDALMLYRQILSAGEETDGSELPLASIRQRAVYLAGLSAEANEPPSTTMSDDGR